MSEFDTDPAVEAAADHADPSTDYPVPEPMEEKMTDQERQIKEAFIDGYTSALDLACGYRERERTVLAERAWREENVNNDA